MSDSRRVRGHRTRECKRHGGRSLFFSVSIEIYADDTTLMAESEEELKSLLMKVKVESEKVGLKLNTLKLQYFGHLMRRVDSLEKTLMLGGTGGRRRRGQQRMRWLDGITDSMDVYTQSTTSFRGSPFEYLSTLASLHVVCFALVILLPFRPSA